MFDYISGSVAAVKENRVIIDCGGVGFSLTASAFTCAACRGKTQVKMPVYLAVREDALELFGFGSETERELFLLLIGVSGMGPKGAISVLGGMDAKTLASAIASGNTAALSSVKGVGKKTAERIVLELKSKIAEIPGIAVTVGEAAQTEQASALDEKAVAALIGLGYDRKEAEKAVGGVAKPDMTTEQIVYAVLKG